MVLCFTGIGTAKWGGTPLAPLLKQAGVLDRGTEVVFWGADSGTEVWRYGSRIASRAACAADAMNLNNCST
jgi:DMSO/TMAO reductase YedYZ molybdopterin-dependent catalytic subunit